MNPMRTLATIILLLFTLTIISATDKGEYCSIAFYNLENGVAQSWTQLKRLSSSSSSSSIPLAVRELYMLNECIGHM